jgi:hypothetical protein
MQHARAQRIARARRGMSYAAALLACVLGCSATALRAYETDQFSNRLTPLADSTAVLNRQVNRAIDEAVATWNGPRDDWKMVNALFYRLGGYHWVDRIEKWAAQSPEVPKLQTERFDSIYSGHPLWAARVTGVFGVGSTFKVNGVLIGSDKLGHYISQGRKFYRRWLRTGDEAQAAQRSAFTERAIFGQMTTGDYSNADLVANYEGHRFYRSLFEDDVIAGKRAILGWHEGQWVVQRPFDWADHVNAYWDEALEINHYDGLLKPHMRARFLTFCDAYRANPAAWTIAPEQDAHLRARYAMLQLRDTSDLRLPNLCGGETRTGAADATH